MNLLELPSWSSNTRGDGSRKGFGSPAGRGPSEINFESPRAQTAGARSPECRREFPGLKGFLKMAHVRLPSAVRRAGPLAEPVSALRRATLHAVREQSQQAPRLPCSCMPPTRPRRARIVTARPPACVAQEPGCPPRRTQSQLSPGVEPPGATQGGAHAGSGGTCGVGLGRLLIPPGEPRGPAVGVGPELRTRTGDPREITAEVGLPPVPAGPKEASRLPRAAQCGASREYETWAEPAQPGGERGKRYRRGGEYGPEASQFGRRALPGGSPRACAEADPTRAGSSAGGPSRSSGDLGPPG
ncbi:hypothetical protein ISCGN_001024 [Ixodes scapularis]